MSRSVDAKSIAAIAAAAIVASLAVFSTSAAQEAKAEPQATSAFLPQPGIKGDRLARTVKGSACSTRGWPHYEHGCQFDLRRPGDEAKTVRIIALR